MAVRNGSGDDDLDIRMRPLEVTYIHFRSSEHSRTPSEHFLKFDPYVLRLAIDARSERRFDGSLQWKRWLIKNTCVRQVELDIGMTADTASNATADRYAWMVV